MQEQLLKPDCIIDITYYLVGSFFCTIITIKILQNIFVYKVFIENQTYCHSQEQNNCQVKKWKKEKRKKIIIFIADSKTTAGKDMREK